MIHIFFKKNVFYNVALKALCRNSFPQKFIEATIKKSTYVFT